MARRIKPYIDEISLAFNPANKKKFHMRKDQDKFKRGGSNMPKAIEILGNKDKMSKEVEIVAFLDGFGKDQFTSDNREAILGAFKLLDVAKDQLPDKFIEKLVKDVPELKDAFTITEVVEKEVQVSADEKKLRKEIETALRKEMKIEKDENIVRLEGELETFKTELSTTKEALDKEKDIRELADIKNFVKENNIPGDLEKVSRTILLARKTNPEMAKDLEETLVASGAALTAAGTFSELGSSAPGETGKDTFGKLQKMVTEAMEKDSNLSSPKAWEKVVKQNSELYKQYTAERVVVTKEVH